MGKRLKQQRRGKGSFAYKAPKSRFKVDLKYRVYDDIEKTSMLTGEVINFVDDPGRNAILMEVLFDNGEKQLLLAPEGIAIGDKIEVGAQAKIDIGNVVPIYRVPDSTYIFNLERRPGDGGKLVKSPGSFAQVIGKEENKVYVKLPSRKIVEFLPDCRVQVGIVSGGGRLEKPLLKAGNAYYKHKARNRLWPKLRGVAQSPYTHPHGGKEHHAGKPTTVSRYSPPGSKVGHVGAKMTGRKKSSR